MREPQGKFIRVRCQECKNEQVIYGKASMDITCLVCQQPLAKATGGKAQVDTQVLEVLD